MKKENNQQCDPCEQKFEKNIDKMVDNVEGYTSADHKECQKEVNDAFGGQHEGKEQKAGCSSKSHGDHQNYQNDNGHRDQQQYREQNGIGSKGQEWKENHSQNGQSGQNGQQTYQGGIRNEAGKQGYNTPAGQHEHKQEGDAYAQKNKTENR